MILDSSQILINPLVHWSSFGLQYYILDVDVPAWVLVALCCQAVFHNTHRMKNDGFWGFFLFSYLKGW